MSENKQLEVDRGRQAKAIMDSALVTESVEKLKQKYIDAWRQTAPEDVQGRERLYTAYGMVDQIFAHLRVVAADGAIAAQALEKLKRRS
jgi:hypothetical protein